MNLLLAAAILLQDPTVEQLIEKLGSEHIEEREKAATKLIELGLTALPALEAAVRSGDAEIASRAEQILRPIRAQIARRSFQAFEVKIRAATHLRTRFTLHIERNELEPLERKGTGLVEDFEGEFLSASPQKIHAVLRNMRSLTVEPRRMICDGEFFTTRTEVSSWNKRSAPADLGGKLTTALVRSGLGYWWMATEGFLFRDPRAGQVLSDFRAGEPEGSVSTILYKLSDQEHVATLQVKVWYDPKIVKLVKRTLDGEMLGKKWSSTESYEDFSIDADITDEKFKLPEEKK
jgi:hypothetical protein